MKIVITGHTQGVGKHIYDYYVSQGHEVIGCSRTTGYDLEKFEDIIRVCELAEGCDLFINNTYAKTAQEDLLDRLYNKVGKMVVFGSVAGDYPGLITQRYAKDKQSLMNRCKTLSTVPDCKLLFLKITFLEDAVTSDITVTFDQVLKTIEFFNEHPVFTYVDYQFKLTPYTINMIQQAFGIKQEVIDQVIGNLCEENKKAFNG